MEPYCCVHNEIGSGSIVNKLQAGGPGFNSRWWVGISCPRHRDKTCFGAHSAFYEKGTEDSFPWGTTAGLETDRSPPSSTEVKNSWIYTSTPPYVFMPWYIIKHRICLEGVVLN